MTQEKAMKIQRYYNWFRFIIVAIFLLAVFSIAANAQTENDFGMWTTIDLEKSLGNKWTVGGGLELRTKNYNMDIDRWQLALNGSYKLSKYFKLGAVYELHLKQYKYNGDAICGVRHRGMIDITGSLKVCNWLKLSLRERYEYTRLMGRTGVTASNDYQWRSRFKMDFPVKKWEPFVSIEAFDDLDDSFRLDEMRVAAGTVYKFNRHHSISLGYLMDMKWGSKDTYTSVITSGYTFRF